MTRLGPYQVHPAADAFPLIEGEEFDDLVADIKKIGLREPIVLTHDKKTLVDGRNRYRACEAADVDVVHETLGSHYSEVMILDYIVSKNVARRHLNQGQKAMAALALEPLYAEAAKVGKPIGHTMRPAVTESNNITPDLEYPRTAGQRAMRALEFTSTFAPDSGGKIFNRTKLEGRRNDRTSAARAAKVTGASRSAVAQAKAVQRDAPDLAARVRAGDLALDAADRQRKTRIASMPKPEPAPKPGPLMLTLRTHKGAPVEYPQPQSKPTFNETTGEGISWAAWSWNPVTGCLHGCTYCYAREIATSERFKASYPVGFTPLFHHERLEAPANTSIPAARRGDPAYRRVFVCSMADLYGRWVPDEWIEKVHASMCANAQWQYITLTKFPARYVGLQMPRGAWVGTSVDEQNRVRIAEDAFRKIDGVAVKWLSLEPLREPLEFEDLSMFDWVVIGAQTETRQPHGVVPAFAPDFDWVSRIYAQAREAGCKVHLKPNLLGKVNSQFPGMQLPDEYPVITV